MSVQAALLLQPPLGMELQWFSAANAQHVDGRLVISMARAGGAACLQS
jgi:hypothetical protein